MDTLLTKFGQQLKNGIKFLWVVDADGNFLITLEEIPRKEMEEFCNEYLRTANADTVYDALQV